MMQRFTSFDFGLTGLAALFHQDWNHIGEVEQVVLTYLSVGEESCADDALKKEAAELERDVSLLISSPLSDYQLRLLWVMATGGNYPFSNGETGRGFLERIHAASRQWQQGYGVVEADAAQGWNSVHVASDVRKAIDGTPLNLPDECRMYFDSDVHVLRNALDNCARSASAELAFRLLLRIHLANFIPVEGVYWATYARIAREFALGEDLLSSLEFLAS
ncbi:hypothetical protein [Streptomyces chattanoogensis]|uniref:hypothetical protein n=1 Tax=Streptomyces chattanoogensis TaxID=66876 RepID=UPI0012FEB239|nr:hypothetical protein [Streptomyces chattanoogensis]